MSAFINPAVARFDMAMRARDLLKKATDSSVTMRPDYRAALIAALEAEYETQLGETKRVLGHQMDRQEKAVSP